MSIPRMKPFLWETEQNGQLKNLHTEESLSAIEQQLLDLEEHHYNIK